MNNQKKLCLYCQSELTAKQKYNKYCGLKCSAIHTQRNAAHRKYTDDDRKKMSDWAKLYAYKHPRTGKYKKCPTCDIEFYLSPSETQVCCSKKCYCDWNKKTGYMKGKTGGYRPTAGRGKMGWYKGYYCNSSWELAWVIYQLDHNVKFKRNTIGYEYNFKNKIYKYYPDFKLDSTEEFVEIKGWLTEKDKEKIKQFQHNLIVLYKKDMSSILKYVIEKYGEEYTDLYEK